MTLHLLSAASSMYGPFMIFRMVQASVYSKLGRSFGVKRKHLEKEARLSADKHVLLMNICDQITIIIDI